VRFFVCSYSRQRLGISNELLISVQGKWLQVVDGNLAIRLLPSLDGRLRRGEFIGQHAGEALFRLRAPGKRIGRPPSELGALSSISSLGATR
jgi:hypothetical protein